MTRLKCAVILLVTLSASLAWAFPEDGVLKELGEVPLKDEMQAPGKTASAPLPTESVSAYGQIDPMDEMAILQRKFQPKRHRFEISGSYGRLVDNAFFETQAIYERVGYSFLETLAAEVLNFSTITKQSQVSDSLYNNGGVVSSNFASPKGFTGANVKWSPIYGKLAFWNTHIVPVEQFFILGAGTMRLSDASNATAVYYGTGFSFAVQKWLALRAGLDVFSYGSSAKSFNDTHLNLGVSFYFPGAEYR